MTAHAARLKHSAFWSLLLAATVAAVWVTGFTPDKMQTWGNAWVFVREMLPPDWSVLPRVLRAMAETLAIAFLGTLIAFVLAFPISFAVARNVGVRGLGAVIRALMSFMRSVPELLWALLFVVATDFGNVAGIFALAAHNLGILTKLIGEVFEGAPPGPREAMAATGADGVTTVWFGILPSALPALLSHTFFRFECNIRTAAILGVVGAGGIGHLLMLHRSLYNYNAMLVDTLGILALVLLADGLGALLRRQVT